jgi:membrane-associated phospholipid phosphatase
MLVFAWAAGARGGVAGESVLVAAAVIVPISVLIGRQRRSGRWETVDASDRRDRPVLYAIAGAAAAAVLGALLLRRDLMAARAVGAVLLIFAVAAASNRWVKTSLHVAFAAFAATALLLLGSPGAWVLALFVPLLAWSRLHLGRHTPVEVVVGVVLGSAVGVLFGS